MVALVQPNELEYSVHDSTMMVQMSESPTREMWQELFQLLDELRPLQLALDLARLRSFSSCTLAMLIKLRLKLRRWGGKLNLENLHPDTREVLSLTLLVRTFDIRSWNSLDQDYARHSLSMAAS
jgi:anti-anti-sigma factor